MGLKVYLSGKMTGMKDFNFPAFDRAAEILRKEGHEVFNPAEDDRRRYPDKSFKSEDGDPADVPWFNKREAMKRDMAWICDHAEAIATLPGWELGRGAKAEYWLAMSLGLPQIAVEWRERNAG